MMAIKPYKKFTEREIKNAEKEGKDAAVFNMRSFNITQDIKKARKELGAKAW